MKKRWDGLVVCKEDFEIRHPQLSLKVHGDKQTVPMPRPEGTDVFLSYCDIWTSSAYADSGTADCMRADYAPLTYQRLLDLKSTNVG